MLLGTDGVRELRQLRSATAACGVPLALTRAPSITAGPCSFDLVATILMSVGLLWTTVRSQPGWGRLGAAAQPAQLSGLCGTEAPLLLTSLHSLRAPCGRARKASTSAQRSEAPSPFCCCRCLSSK